MASTRISRDEVLMTTAFSFARRTTCSRASVGAIFSLDGRILSTGYNGTPAGMPHCDHECTCGKYSSVRIQHMVGCPADNPCTRAVHAEANGIAWAARNGVPLQNSHLHVTVSPCVPCAQLIINAGVTAVFFAERYRSGAGLALLMEANVFTTELIIDRS